MPHFVDKREPLQQEVIVSKKIPYPRLWRDVWHEINCKQKEEIGKSETQMEIRKFYKIHKNYKLQIAT